MIHCEAAELLMHRAEDGEASEADRAALAGHCGACAACAGARAELGAMRRLIAEALPRPAGASFGASLRRRLEGERARERYWNEAGQIASRWSRIAAAFALALGLGAAAVVTRGARAPAGESPAAETPEGAQVARAGAEDVLLHRSPLTADVIAELALASGVQ